MAEKRGSRLPSTETIIIVVFFLFFTIWGFSKCNDSRNKARLAAEAKLTPRQRDSISRYATPALPVQTPQPIATPTTAPQQEIPTVNVPVAQNPRVITPGNVPTATTPAPTVNTQTSINQSVTINKSAQVLYVHEPNLNVRTEPSLTAKSLGTLTLGATVMYLDRTKDTEALSVGAKTADEPWFKIKTKRGTVGWVYGAYVKFYAPKH